VTVVDRRKELLRMVDDEIIALLISELSHLGVKFRLGEALGKFERAKGSAKLKIKLGKRSEQFDAALVCMGRTPNVESLMLDKAGVSVDARGYIPVNAQYQTNLPHIYAVGDVIGSPALAATSSEQGRIASRHAIGLSQESFPALFPSGIYTDPEIAFTGMGERELLEKKIPYVAGRAHYAELARGQILGDEKGLLKLFIHRETRELLGTHIIGKGATELVHIGLVLQKLGAKVDFIKESVFNYPTLAEAYKVAAYNAVNQIETNS
jgi:NAD(P) transhydrogenase